MRFARAASNQAAAERRLLLRMQHPEADALIAGLYYYSRLVD
jgi:hypothetical protein